MRPEIIKGRVCYSVMGRDKGKLFVVTEIPDKDHVIIADGVLRKTDKQKKKNKKHVMATRYLLDEEVFTVHRNELDSMIRRKLREIQDCIDNKEK